MNNGQKREDPGNEDLFLLIAIVTSSKYFFVSGHLFRRRIYENLNFFKRLARLSTQLFVFVASLARKLKLKFITWNPETANVFASHTTLNPF